MLTIITPTRYRASSFSLLERYMANQTLQPDQWIVVCDGGIDEYKFTMGQTVIHRKPHSSPLHSINANYLEAVTKIGKTTKLLFGEDDDWYHPEFIATYSKWLDSYDLVGLGRNRYYHVGNKAHCHMRNTAHSSLASTGITSAVLGLFQEVCLEGDPFIDVQLWQRWDGSKHLSDKNYLHVGLKGVEGHPGYGIGHCLSKPVDEDYRVLREWLGGDADKYINFSSQGL